MRCGKVDISLEHTFQVVPVARFPSQTIRGRHKDVGDAIQRSNKAASVVLAVVWPYIDGVCSPMPICVAFFVGIFVIFASYVQKHRICVSLAPDSGISRTKRYQINERGDELTKSDAIGNRFISGTAFVERKYLL